MTNQSHNQDAAKGVKIGHKPAHNQVYRNELNRAAKEDIQTERILQIAKDFGCDSEGLRPHLEQILNQLLLEARKNELEGIKQNYYLNLSPEATEFIDKRLQTLNKET